MSELAQQVREAAEAIDGRWPRRPRIGLILGTGLGSLADAIRVDIALDYASIPHFARSTAASHAGRLVCGQLAGLPVVAMAGRMHCYEGYSLDALTLPVRVMARLGIETLVVSNAAGGLNPRLAGGDVVVLDDYIDFLRRPTAAGSSSLSAAPLRAAFDRGWIERAERVARQAGIALARGVYVAMTGPNLETRAEYRMLRLIGGDVVGMSTVPETIVAAECGLRVVAFSVVSNVCLPDGLGPMTSDEIVATAARGEQKLRQIVLALLAEEAASLPTTRGRTRETASV